MTPEQFAQFTIFNELNFYGGLLLGLIIAGFFKTLMSFFFSELQRPRRIRFRSLNRKDQKFEYFYLYRGFYYEKEQREFLIKEHLEEMKQRHKPSFPSLLLFFIPSILFFVMGYLLAHSPFF
ncbi:hypothetical protein [Acinetobacter bohemicus]|uniref:hypothetical protein n=1 Tax=Acinetobacter bohemicus TaxID=1435036 RepID=UPI0040413E0A